MHSFSIPIKTIIAILVVLLLAVSTQAHMSYSFSAPDANLSKEQQLQNRHMNHFKKRAIFTNFKEAFLSLVMSIVQR